jgi:hypothetical protein
MTNQKQRPAHEIRVRTVKASIWANQSQKSGTWYCVTFQRIYKVGDVWKRTSGFGVNDLPEISRLAEQATRWIEQTTKMPVQIELPMVTQPAAT